MSIHDGMHCNLAFRRLDQPRGRSISMYLAHRVSDWKDFLLIFHSFFSIYHVLHVTKSFFVLRIRLCRLWYAGLSSHAQSSRHINQYESSEGHRRNPKRKVRATSVKFLQNWLVFMSMKIWKPYVRMWNPENSKGIKLLKYDRQLQYFSTIISCLFLFFCALRTIAEFCL
jgi:hypothetical protein